MQRIIQSIFILAFTLLISLTALAGNYTVVVSQTTHGNPDWQLVVNALQAKHNATVLTYTKSLDELLPKLQSTHPRYTCFVAQPNEATRAFVAHVHQLTRKYDTDPYTDTLWGILTGYDAQNALRIAKHNKPLTIHKVASGTEVALEKCTEGIWYCELVKNKMVKKEKGGTASQHKVPTDTTKALAQTLTDYNADLFVTSGHATERNWQIGYRYRNGYFVSKAGQLFGQTIDKQQFKINSPNPKVYMPIGNCLMGNIDAPDAMALAWMNSAGVNQMLGYTVPTWFGYSGWGVLDYFIEQPGRYTYTEAFHVNQHALIHRLHTYFPEVAKQNVEVGKMFRGQCEITPEGKAFGIGINDGRGLLFDRDVVAFYGDPKWEARLAPAKKSYKQSLTREGNTYTFTITPNLGEKSFHPVNTNGAQRGWRPIVQLLPQRIKNIKITTGQAFKPVITDDFILVPNPRECDPNQPITITFTAEPVKASKL